MRIYRKKSKFDSCRSFFIYNDGRLFVQFVHKEDSPQCIGSTVYIDMKGGEICGTLTEIRGTGIILDNWTVTRSTKIIPSIVKNLTEL